MTKRVRVIIITSLMFSFGLIRQTRLYGISNIDLVKDIRTYFSISQTDASDEYLKAFLKNDDNKKFMIAVIRQIDFGSSIRTNLPVNTDELFSILTKKPFRELVTYLIRNNPLLSSLNTIESVFETIDLGIKIYRKFADLIVNINIWTMANDYRDGRYRKPDESIDGIWDEIRSIYYDEIMKLLAKLKSTEAKVRDFCEIYYQSWRLANNEDGDLDTLREFILVGLPNRSPNTPASPSGPLSGFIGISYSFGTSTTDADGDDIKYQYDWDWPNGRLSSWGDSTRSYSWDSPDNYQIAVKARDSHGAESAWSSPSLISISFITNTPPDTPAAPAGPSSGFVGTRYTFSTSSTDPDGDAIEYNFNWDGVHLSGWGVSTRNYSWDSPGDYQITVKARDSRSAESAWSPALTISISGSPLVGTWPMFLHDGQNSGQSECSGPRMNNLAWTYTIASILPTGYLGTPVVAQDGTIYIGSGTMSEGYLWAIDRNGNFRWRSPNLGACPSVPAIAEDGTIFLGTHDFGAYFYALSPEDGSIKWSYFVGDSVSEIKIAQDATIYFTSETGYLYALDKEGALVWQYFLGRTTSGPTLGLDGTIYVTWGVQLETVLLAINPTGTFKWSQGLWGGQAGSPVSISKNGIIYACSRYNLFALGETAGAILWTYYCDREIDISIPIQTIDDRIVLAGKGKIYFIRVSDGSLIGTYDEAESDNLFPLQCVSDKDGVVYTGFRTESISGPSKILAINPDKTKKWSYSVPWIYTQPAVSDGAIYIAGVDDNYNYKIYAFRLSL